MTLTWVSAVRFDPSLSAHKLFGCCSFLQFAATQQLQTLMDIPVDVLRPLYDEMDRQISLFDQVCLSVQNRLRFLKIKSRGENASIASIVQGNREFTP